MNKKPEANPDNVGKVLSVLEIDTNSWFEAREDGLYFVERKEKEEKGKTIKFSIPTRLTYSPLEIVGFLEPIDGDIDRGLLVRIPKEVTVRREDVAKAADLEGWLANHGVRFDPTHTAKIRRYFQIWYGNPITAYTRNGWQRDGAFVIGDQIIRGEGRVIKTEANLTTFESRGTFDQWQEETMPRLARKPGWLFGVLVALSSPLLKPLSIPTGFIINLSGDSRTGKTISLKAHAACWGEPTTDGCLMTFETTENAIEGMAEAASDIGLALDEMERADPSIITKIVYKFANGQGKKRFSTNSKMQRTRSWRCAALVSSEKTIEGIFDAQGTMQAAGQVVRSLDIDSNPLLPRLPIEQVEEVENALTRCYGVAGPEFIRRIMDQDLKQQHNEARRMLYAGEDGRIQTVATTLALLVVAGKVMDIDTSMVKEVFDCWLTKEAKDSLDANLQVAKRIVELIDKKTNSTILPLDEEWDDDAGTGEAGSTYQARDGWYDGEHVYLLAETVKKALGGHGRNTFYEWCRGHDLIKARSKRGATVVVERLRHRPTAVAFFSDRLRELVEEAE